MSLGYDIVKTYPVSYKYVDERSSILGCSSSTILTDSGWSAISRVAKSATVSRRPYSHIPHPFRAPTPYTRRVIRMVANSGSWRGSKTTFDWCRGSYVPWTVNYHASTLFFNTSSGTSYLNDEVYPSYILNQAEIKLLQKIKSDGEASLGLALLERKETEDLFITAINRIAGPVTHLRFNKPHVYNKAMKAYAGRQSILKSGRKPSRRELKLLAIPELWLELQYGWKPLMQDVVQAMNAVDFYQKNDRYFFAKRVKFGVQSTRQVNMNVSPYAGPKVVFNMKRLDAALCRVDYKINTGSVLQPLASLGLLNPVDLVWERVPFSFVVDWFLPLGSWFNTFDATIGKSFIGGSYTRLIREDSTSVSGSYGGIVDWVYPDGFAASKLQMDRSVYLTFPTPAPPTLKNPCSPSHVANALSLLAAAFGRGVPRGLRR